MKKKKYLISDAYGMCRGVLNALETLEDLIDSQEENICVFRELVHNRHVTESLKQRGVMFADKVDDVPQGCTVVIGAHGVSPEIESRLRARAAKCSDVTCPLVKKLHRIAAGTAKGDSLIIFGKSGHPEVEGVAGFSGTDDLHMISSVSEALDLPPLEHPIFISQTTVDHDQVVEVLDVLQKKYPDIRISSGICDASKKRQDAVRHLAEKVDAVIVIGSSHSSNARRLCEVVKNAGKDAVLADGAGDIPEKFLQYSRVGITSGASTPQYLFDAVVQFMENAGFSRE